MKTELEILKEAKLLFDFHSDLSTFCLGYKALCSKIKELESISLSLKESDCKVSEEEIEPDGWIIGGNFFKTDETKTFESYKSFKSQPVYFSPQPKEVKEVSHSEVFYKWCDSCSNNSDRMKDSVMFSTWLEQNYNLITKPL